RPAARSAAERPDCAGSGGSFVRPREGRRFHSSEESAYPERRGAEMKAQFLSAVTIISLFAACRSPDHPRTMAIDLDGRNLVIESAGPGRMAVAVYAGGKILGPAELALDSEIRNGLSE